MIEQSILNVELVKALSCSTSTERISFVDNDGVARVAVENLRQLRRLLQREGQSLDTLIEAMQKQCFHVALTPDPGAEPHFITFDKTAGSLVIMANSPHTDGDVQVLDLRIASVAPAMIQNRPYTSYFVALEIFREFGGNQSTFQLGLYLVDDESERLAFWEAENIRVTGPEARGALRRVLIEFARGLSRLDYSPDIMRGKLLQPAAMLLLAQLIEQLGQHGEIVPVSEYFEKLRYIFAYLQGTNVEERTKFQHNFHPATQGLLYRVQLLRPNLSSLPFDEDHGSDYAVESFRKSPGYGREEALCRKLCSAKDGERVFLEECQRYLDMLYREADLPARHFELAPFQRQDSSDPLPHVDLRYVTILRTRDDQPLVLTHWRIRHDSSGKPLPRDAYIDRFQFWNKDGDFACLEEGRDFRAGIEQVKTISKQILACANNIDSRNLQSLARQLADCGVNLRYERRT